MTHEARERHEQVGSYLVMRADASLQEQVEEDLKKAGPSRATAGIILDKLLKSTKKEKVDSTEEKVATKSEGEANKG